MIVKNSVILKLKNVLIRITDITLRTILLQKLDAGFTLEMFELLIKVHIYVSVYISFSYRNAIIVFIMLFIHIAHNEATV